jgi:hypothetical protein
VVVASGEPWRFNDTFFARKPFATDEAVVEVDDPTAFAVHFNGRYVIERHDRTPAHAVGLFRAMEFVEIERSSLVGYRKAAKPKRRGGGRKREAAWNAWIAELVAYLVDNGTPTDEQLVRSTRP